MPGNLLWTVLWVLMASMVVLRPPTDRRLARVLRSRSRIATSRHLVARARTFLLRMRPLRSAPGAVTVDVAELADQLASLMRAGLPPTRAWQALASVPGDAQEVCRSVADRLAIGGSASDGLRVVAGPAGLSWLATTQESAERIGAPLAQVLDAFADGCREDDRAAAEREAALAGPRASGTVLGLLPAVGIGFGYLLGAAPLRTLLFTGAGRGCLVVGAGLWLLGWWWTRILILRAERAGDVHAS